MGIEKIMSGLTVCNLRHQHPGSTMAVIGCGPSLRGFDFERLLQSKIITIGTNRIGLLYSTDYWIATETEQVLLDILTKLKGKTKALVRVDAGIKTDINVQSYVYRAIGEKWILSKTRKCIDPVLYEPRFAVGEFYSFASVVTSGIEFCRFADASKIFLFGVDLNVHEDGSYYFNKSWKPNINEKNRNLVNVVLSDGTKATFLMMHWRMLRGFLLASRSIWQGIDVINVSPGTKVSTFPVWTHEQFWHYVEENELE